jgi:hypothetical protein
MSNFIYNSFFPGGYIATSTSESVFFPPPSEELPVEKDKIVEQEQEIHSEFFVGRPLKTPDRYRRIRNYILDAWQVFLTRRKSHFHILRKCIINWNNVEVDVKLTLGHYGVKTKNRKYSFYSLELYSHWCVQIGVSLLPMLRSLTQCLGYF